MIFTISIETDNDAFSVDAPAELMGILQEVIEMLEADHGFDNKTPLLDSNGNVVGHAEWK